MVSMRSSGAFCVAALELFHSIGYGIWAVIGAALAFNLDLDGRGGVLVPLLLGLVFIAVGQAGTVLADLGPRRWRAAARSLSGPRPRPESLLALFTFVVMLALAGLVRGDNTFWATRALGALLPVSCVVTLLVARRQRHEAPAPLRLRPGGLLAIVFCGGLWLWLIMTLQNPPPSPQSVCPLLLGLLMAGMGAWLSTQMPPTRSVSDEKLNHRLVIVLAFTAPCLLLVAASMWHGYSVMAAIAALSCQVGLSINELLHAPSAFSVRRPRA